MTQERLSALLKRPDVQRTILRQYHGAYSIGLTSNPARRGEMAIRVRIEGEDSNRVAKQIVLDDEVVPVVVNTGYSAPHAAPLAV